MPPTDSLVAAAYIQTCTKYRNVDIGQQEEWLPRGLLHALRSLSLTTPEPPQFRASIAGRQALL